jgi:asparagine synthase (glutamine-hydrolysing)
MCGLAGILDLGGGAGIDREVLADMTATLRHRGPDAVGSFVGDGVGLGFARLSVIDLATGDQPIFNEDGSLVLVCNGEIYNYGELRAQLREKGHTLRTESDVEVLLHLYEDHGVGFLETLNGQFAFALYDRRRRQLLLARDHCGIAPLFYTVVGGQLIFASEIKAILRHPRVERHLDPTGLDQLLSFPGLVSPTTMFRGILGLENGHYLLAREGRVRGVEYWDLEYPRLGEIGDGRPEGEYVDELRELLTSAVHYRLQADVPVGLYLSGGMDSSLVALLASRLAPDPERHTFSITFGDQEICEAPFQRLMARAAGSIHHEIRFDWEQIADRLRSVIYQCECPLKESFNTCSLALSEAAHAAGIKVVLAGEGADELFAGYPGYRFDELGLQRGSPDPLEAVAEEEIRERLWGDAAVFYEKDQVPVRELKRDLYSDALNQLLPTFDCLDRPLVNSERLLGRHPIHQRAYLDFKLRLSEHLLSEHGDRMVMASSVEGRYPFLDLRIIDFARRLPPGLKVKGYVEKYIVKQMARDLLPAPIVQREKFGFRAPGCPFLLQQRIPWVEDLLSTERIRRQGYFNPAAVEHLKALYSRPGFSLHPHLDTDLLMVVLTFNLFCDLFGLPDLNG